MNLTVIIPAHNEEARIGATLNAYLRYFGARLRFLVVVNGTTDRTAAMVQPYLATHPGTVELVVIPERIGKGGAILEGFQRATTELVGFLDADGATPPEEFEKLLTALDRADGAIASRYKPGSRAQRTFLRWVIGLAFRTTVRLLIGLPFYDTQVGAKVFRRDQVQAILPELTTRNMAFDVELLGLLVRNGARIEEVPTVWHEIPGPVGGWQRTLVRTGFEMLGSLLAIRRKLRSPHHETSA